MPLRAPDAELLRDLYRSAVDERFLEPFLEHCSSSLESHNVGLLVQDMLRPSGSSLHCNPGQRDVAASYARFAGQNVFLEAAVPYLRVGDTFRTNQHLDPKALLRSRFYADYCNQVDIFHSMAATIELDRRHLVGLTLNRQRSAPFSREEERWLQQLMPHLQTWWAIRRRIGELELAQQAAWESLNLLRYGVLVLNERHRVLFTNRAAEELAVSSSLLALNARSVSAKQPDAASWLAETVNRVLASGASRGPGGARRLRDDVEDLGLVVAPLDCDSPMGTNRLCVLFITDLTMNPRGLAENLASAFDLTRRESEVACLLIQGLATAQIATKLAVKPSTIRSHVKRVFMKAGVNRQADLVRLGMNLSAG